MSSNNSRGNSGSSGGIGFLGLLQVAFIVLKLIGIITWSWVKVFIPCYIGIALIVIGILAVGAFTTWLEKK